MNAGSVRRDLAAAILGQAMSAGASLILTPLLTRSLGVSGFGSYSLANGLIGYASILDMGIGIATIQVLSRAVGANDWGTFGRTFGAAIAVCASVSLVLSAIMLAIPAAIADALNTVSFKACVPWMALGIVPALLRSVLEGALAATGRLVAMSLVSGASALIRTLLIVAAVSARNDPVYAVGALAVSNCVHLLVLCFLVGSRRFKKARPLAPSTVAVTDLLKTAFPMWVMVIGGNLASVLDRVWLSRVHGTLALGGYVAAMELATRIWPLTSIFGRVFTPRMMREAGAKNWGGVSFHLQRWSLLALSLSSVVLIPLFVFPTFAMKTWTGADVGGQVLCVLIIGITANVFSGPFLTVLQAVGDNRWLGYLYAVVPVFQIPFLLLGIYLWGAIGAASAWSAGLVFISIAQFVRCIRKNPHARVMRAASIAAATPCIAFTAVGVSSVCTYAETARTSFVVSATCGVLSVAGFLFVKSKRNRSADNLTPSSP